MTVVEQQRTEPEQEPSPREAGAERKTLSEDYWEGELIPRSDPRSAFISVNPERLGERRVLSALAFP